MTEKNETEKTEEGTAPDSVAELSHAEEVEARSADGSDGDSYIKEFRVVQSGATIREDAHNRNKDGVLREAINRGLHPKGEVQHLSTELVSETRRGVKTYAVRYSVPVRVSSEDEAPEETVTPATNPDKPQAKEAKPGEVSRDNAKKTDPAVAKKVDPPVEKSDDKPVEKKAVETPKVTPAPGLDF